MSGNAPSGTQSVALSVTRSNGIGAVSGDIFYVDRIMLTDQSSSFATGNTSGWVWNGPTNNSTSTGPAL